MNRVIEDLKLRLQWLETDNLEEQEKLKNYKERSNNQIQHFERVINSNNELMEEIKKAIKILGENK